MIRMFRLKPLQLIVRVVLLLTATAFAALPAYPQRAQLDALASRTAEVLNKGHVKTVVVADFWNPEKKITKLGDSVADQFSASLEKAPGKLKVIGRGRLRETLSDLDLPALVLDDSQIAQWIANRIHAKAIIVGKIENDAGHFHLAISIIEVSPGKIVGSYAVALPVSADWGALFTSPLVDEIVAKAVEPGKKGYTAPSCLYCPAPVYPDAGFSLKTQASALLDCTVTTGGRASDIIVKGNLPDGFSEAAVRAVQNWLFKPALGPDGKPSPVRLIIRVEFRNFH